jgi:endonuclease/exonuclease/phosphatase (EEP) superfamily protein YafD
MRPRLKSAAEVLGLAIAALAAITAFSFAGRQLWLAELTSHFRPHLAAAGLAAALLALTMRRRLASAAALAAMIVNVAPVLPYLIPLAVHAASPGERLVLLVHNLHNVGTDLALLESLLDRESPDVIVLTELPRDRSRLLDLMASRYAHRFVDEGRFTLSVAVFSRWRIQDAHIDRRVGAWAPVTSLSVCAPEIASSPASCLSLVALHAAWPLAARGQVRAAQLAIAAQFAAESPTRRVALAGDLNLTPWSPDFATLLAAGGLRDSARGHGLVATWFSRLPVIGLPIDHVLVGERVDVISRRVGPDLGSDHLPLITELALR